MNLDLILERLRERLKNGTVFIFCIQKLFVRDPISRVETCIRFLKFSRRNLKFNSNLVLNREREDSKNGANALFLRCCMREFSRASIVRYWFERCVSLSAMACMNTLQVSNYTLNLVSKAGNMSYCPDRNRDEIGHF